MKNNTVRLNNNGKYNILLFKHECGWSTLPNTPEQAQEASRRIALSEFDAEYTVKVLSDNKHIELELNNFKLPLCLQ